MKNNTKVSRIEKKFEELRQAQQNALALFLTAGYPELQSTVPLALLCAEAGADILEIGMPFSDPLADGPVIQECSQRALNNGVTLPWIFEQIRSIRLHSSIPIVLMGYLNPLLRYGVERFFADAADAGVDGIILPEVPLEEMNRFSPLAQHYGISPILLVTPTTPTARVKKIDTATKGFLYCVSATGVTGHSTTEAEVEAHVRRIVSVAKNPVLVGFGIKTAEQAQKIGRLADGVIIGSSFLRIIQQHNSAEILQWIEEIRRAL